MPRVHFTLRHNERQVFDLPATENLRTRIAALFGRELAERFDFRRQCRRRRADFRLRGHPSQSRSNNRMQYLFLNGRHIRDHALQHAFAEAYRGLLMVGRYAIAFLSIEMPPDMVDVNVHPTKLEVRFRDGGRLYSQLLSTLRGKFLTTDLTTQGQPRRALRRPAAPTTRPAPHKSARNWSLGPKAKWPAGKRRRRRCSRRGAARARAATADEPWARSEPLRQYSFPAADAAASRRPLELTNIHWPRPGFPKRRTGFRREWRHRPRGCAAHVVSG